MPRTAPIELTNELEASQLAGELARAGGVMQRVAEARGCTRTYVAKLVKRFMDLGLDVFAMAGVKRKGPGHPIEHGAYAGWRDPKRRQRNEVVRDQQNAANRAARARKKLKRVVPRNPGSGGKPAAKREGAKKDRKRD